MLTTIRARAIAAITGFVLLIVAGVAMTSITVMSQSGDGAAINMAGRQRMLIQRCGKAALATRVGGSASSREELTKAIGLFETSQKALLSGGTVPAGANVTVELSAVDDPQTRELLQRVDSEWPEYRALLDAAANGQEVDMGKILTLSNTLLVDANNAVKRLEAASGAKLARLQYTQLIILVAGLGLGAFIAFRSRSVLLDPLRRLAEHAEEAAAGRVSGHLEIADRHDDLGRVAQGFSHVQQSLKEITTSCKAMRDGDFSHHSASASELSSSTVKPVFEQLEKLVGELKRVASAARNGELDARGDSDRFPGEFGAVIDELNHMLDATFEPVSDAQGVLARIAEGDLSNRETPV